MGQYRHFRLLVQISQCRLDGLEALALCRRAPFGDSMQLPLVSSPMPVHRQPATTATNCSTSRHASTVMMGHERISAALQVALSASSSRRHLAATAGYGEDKSSIPSSRGASGSSSQEATSQPADHPSLEGQEPLEDAETPFSDDADDAAASLQHPQGADSAALKGDAAAPAAKGESDDGEDEAAFAQPPQPLQAEAEEAATLDSWNASPSLSAFFTEFKRSSPQKQKFMLKRMMAGREELFVPQRTPEQQAWLQYQQEAFRANFRSQVVEVRGVSKGTRTGGIRRFSAVVVVGNSQGTLGLGSGKASELQAAVAKANMRALKTLFFVPRYCDATIYQAQVAKFGKAKVIMYPRSTGSGIRACGMVTSICNLAGIRDIGVKIHGTRNQRNIAKALITAFEAQMIPAEQTRSQQAAAPPVRDFKQMTRSLPQLARLLAASTV